MDATVKRNGSLNVGLYLSSSQLCPSSRVQPFLEPQHLHQQVLMSTGFVPLASPVRSLNSSSSESPSTALWEVSSPLHLVQHLFLLRSFTSTMEANSSKILWLLSANGCTYYTCSLSIWMLLYVHMMLLHTTIAQLGTESERFLQGYWWDKEQALREAGASLLSGSTYTGITDRSSWQRSILYSPRLLLQHVGSVKCFDIWAVFKCWVFIVLNLLG